MITSYVTRIEQNSTYSNAYILLLICYVIINYYYCLGSTLKYYLIMTNKRKRRINTLRNLVTFVLEICHYVDHNHLFCDICCIYSLLLLNINLFYKIMISFIFLLLYKLSFVRNCKVKLELCNHPI